MCVIVYKPKGKRFDKAELDMANEIYNDGSGIMWAENNQLHIKKFLDYEESIKFFDKELKLKETKLSIAWHLRLKTKGKINLENVQPFSVSKGVGLCHNGTFSSINDPDLSDSKIFAEQILNVFPKRFYKHDGLNHLLNEFIKPSKVVVLDRYGHSVIYNEKGGIWKDGLWYSNRHYVTTKSTWGSLVARNYPVKSNQIKPVYNKNLKPSGIAFMENYLYFDKGQVKTFDVKQKGFVNLSNYSGHLIRDRANEIGKFLKSSEQCKCCLGNLSINTKEELCETCNSTGAVELHSE